MPRYKKDFCRSTGTRYTGCPSHSFTSNAVQIRSVKTTRCASADRQFRRITGLASHKRSLRSLAPRTQCSLSLSGSTRRPSGSGHSAWKKEMLLLTKTHYHSVTRTRKRFVWPVAAGGSTPRRRPVLVRTGRTGISTAMGAPNTNASLVRSNAQ